MAIMFADDFKGYGTTLAYLLDGLYAEAQGALVTDPDPLASGPVYRFGAPNSGTWLRRVFPSSVTTAGVCFRLWVSSLPTFNLKSCYFRFADGANVQNVSIFILTTGALRVLSPTGATLGQTSGPVIAPNSWNHIEVKAVASATVGTVEIRVNGVSVLTTAAGNTGLEYSQFRFDTAFAALEDFSTYVKDFIGWNSSGANNNTFLGTVSVIGMVPSSDVSLNWTPSTGSTGWNLLDNSPPLDGSQYLTAPFPLPAASTFGLTDLPTNVTSVRAMITQVRARKADGGDGSLQNSIISVAAVANGANRPVTTAFTYYEDVFEVDPNTSAPWTPSAANGAVLKINRTV